MVTGEIFDIKRYATHDGPGIRSTVFLCGCPLRCWWCHNPEGLALGESGSPEEDAEDISGMTAGRGTPGRVTVAAVADEVERDTVFYDQSGGGVTFSGGEPFMQPEFLKDLLETQAL